MGWDATRDCWFCWRCCLSLSTDHKRHTNLNVMMIITLVWSWWLINIEKRKPNQSQVFGLPSNGCIWWGLLFLLVKGVTDSNIPIARGQCGLWGSMLVSGLQWNSGGVNATHVPVKIVLIKPEKKLKTKTTEAKMHGKQQMDSTTTRERQWGVKRNQWVTPSLAKPSRGRLESNRWWKDEAAKIVAHRSTTQTQSTTTLTSDKMEVAKFASGLCRKKTSTPQEWCRS